MGRCEMGGGKGGDGGWEMGGLKGGGIHGEMGGRGGGLTVLGSRRPSGALTA